MFLLKDKFIEDVQSYKNPRAIIFSMTIFFAMKKLYNLLDLASIYSFSNVFKYGTYKYVHNMCIMGIHQDRNNKDPQYLVILG